MFEKPLNHYSIFAENSVLASNIGHSPKRNYLIDSFHSSITTCILRVNLHLSRLDSVEIYQTIEEFVVTNTIFEAEICEFLAV